MDSGPEGRQQREVCSLATAISSPFFMLVNIYRFFRSGVKVTSVKTRIMKEKQNIDEKKKMDGGME